MLIIAISKSSNCIVQGEPIVLNAAMPNRRSQRSRRGTPNQHPSTSLNQSSARSEEWRSEPSQDEREAGVSSTLDREAPVECTNAASINGILNPNCFNSSSIHIMELGRVALRNCDRVRSQKRYCLEVKIHEASSKGCRAILTTLWSSANIVDIIEDDLDVTEAVVLDDTTALLYVGQRSTGEGLMEEEAQAGIDHFSPYVEWRGMALECDFQALTSAEGRDLMRAYEVWSQKILRG